MILYGASGHCKVIFEILEALGKRPVVIWDDAPKADIYGVQVTRPDHTLASQQADMIVSIGDNRIRKLIAERSRSHFIFACAFHPAAIISGRATIGAGTVAMAGVVINADATIGSHCIINSSAVIEHECILDDYVHISPNATLCGNVSVGEGTHMGAGSIAIPGVKIGAWCRIGAGAVVIRDVPDGCTVVGNPGRIIKGL